jgi:enoyl-CoA hydratase/carnithine racemase
MSTKHAASDELRVRLEGEIAHYRLHRPSKRNALSDALVRSLHAAFSAPPKGAMVIVLSGEGEHFCSGLDLSAVRELTAAEGIAHSRMWHAAFDQIQFGAVPVIAVLHGATVGGGLELASSAHIRVAETTTFYALPEGQRGLFTGGGGSARIPRLIGTARMADMMLTGRVFDAHEGHAAGLSTYLVDPGRGLEKAFEIAAKVAANAPLTNFAVMHALPRIVDQSQSDGLFTESLMAAIAQSDAAAKHRVRAFLEKKAGKIAKS